MNWTFTPTYEIDFYYTYIKTFAMKTPMKNSAKGWLKIAIDRHQRHMDEKEPTEGKEGEMSQMLMMEEMKMAYKGMTRDEDVEAQQSYMKLLMEFEKMEKMEGGS